jgi:hypothetical protein
MTKYQENSGFIILEVYNWAMRCDDGEAVVDGRHASDLGFERMADGLYPVLCEALNQK